MENTLSPTVDPEMLLASLMTDIYNIVGVSRARLLHRPLDWLTRRPLLRFCQAFAETDRIIAREGFAAGARWLVTTWFARQLSVRGRENVPPSGPLVVVSNHPGAIDSPSIGACLGRDDLKIVASNVPFLRRLPTVSQHLIFIADDAPTRMTTIRQAVRHLGEGGALLIFPTGLIDPDPGHMRGAVESLEDWSGSVEIFLRKVPEAMLLPVVASDVLHPAMLRSPLVRLQKPRWKQQRMAEFLQFVRQLGFPGSLWLEPKLTFGRPLTLPELEAAAPGRRLRDAVIAVERDLLVQHASKPNSGYL